MSDEAIVVMAVVGAFAVLVLAVYGLGTLFAEVLAAAS